MLGMRSLLNAEMPQTGIGDASTGTNAMSMPNAPTAKGASRPIRLPRSPPRSEPIGRDPQTRKRIVPFTRPSRRSAAKEKSGDLAAPSPSVIDSMLMLAPGIARATAAWR